MTSLTELAWVLNIPLPLWLILRPSSPPRHPPSFPGPKPLPVFGNLLPPTRVWLTLSVLAETWGPVYSLRFLRTPVVVVNSAKAAHEIFELRSAKYANRTLPKIAEMYVPGVFHGVDMACSYSGFDRGVALEHDLTRMRLGRKVIRSVMQPREIEKYYRSRIQHYLAFYLDSVLARPDEFMQHAQLLLSRVMLEISHGYEVSGPRDPVLSEAKKVVANFNQASNARGHLVNWLPFLSYLPGWLPGMGFKKRALAWRQHYDAASRAMFEWTKAQMAKGSARPSMVHNALSALSGEKISDDIIMYSSVQVYAGGAESTSSVINSFILMMVRHPDVQQQARAEVDSVIGRDRLPTIQDRGNLPYTNAVLSEVLRVLPPITATLREPDGEDVYMGYLIPSGAILIENFWGILHDPNVYPDPHAFNPERWLNADVEGVYHPLNIAFGYGRRACPGRVLAEDIAFTVVALLLALFEMSCVKDGLGRPVVPPLAHTDASISSPLPFPCVILPRDDRAREHIRE